ncbi:FlaD/FlaE family flagellar protein [Salarchaeum japonicum]|uniref:Archaeal flagella protein FlaD/E domain-containing protein n=1 Tax=Salarchaeum japonicum TaxID=555573 RepID=A0AAV3T1Z9_9EURY|nr:FlaD/FlaE family flagellar protein [Salarchaeum japonicum]
MNLGDVMRELGLDSLVPNTQSKDEERDAEADAEQTDADSETDDEAADSGETETESEPEPQPPRISTEAFEGDVGDAVEELQYNLDEVRNRVGTNESAIESLENDQESMEARLDEIQETNATLLGVYDRLTDDINPFSSSSERDAVAPDDETYGVMSGEASDDIGHERHTTEDADEDESDDEDVVSFEDLKANLDADADADEEPDAEDDEAADEPVEPPARPVSASQSGDSPYLNALAPTYATDVLLMQWVSMLVDTAGPAGALKTIDYYAQIDWISPSVKRQLETVLSGAHDLDEDQPSRPPSELSVEAHSESFEHIQKLAQQTELAGT